MAMTQSRTKTEIDTAGMPTQVIGRLLAQWKRRAVQRTFDRYMRWRLPQLVRPDYPVILKYPVRPNARYGDGKPPHPALGRFFAESQQLYAETLTALEPFTAPIGRIAETATTAAPGEPYWQNIFFSGLDAIVLYGLLGQRRPARYFEVGSGNSTKFARRAVRDLELQTEIISLDPRPRAEVDTLCDCVIREALEDVEMSVFDRLDAGDVLFIDSSHVVFENSDVTVFFLEVLPRLKPGVIVHLHDIFLPFDYPSLWADRHYSEQYLLAAYVLGGASRLHVMAPLAYMSHDPALAALVDATWSTPVLQRAFAYNRQLTGGYTGTSLWFSVE